MITVCQAFLQSEESVQVSVRLDAVVGCIPLAPGALMQGVEVFVLADCKYVNTIVVLGIDVDADNTGMRFKAFLALLLELAGRSYG